MNGNTVRHGLEITDLDPIAEKFGSPRTAYYETIVEAVQAARPYVKVGGYDVVVTTEVFDYDNAWHTINREEVA